MQHELKKISPEYFDAVHSGIKPFVVRKNDRPFKVGDSLLLKETAFGSFVKSTDSMDYSMCFKKIFLNEGVNAVQDIDRKIHGKR